MTEYKIIVVSFSNFYLHGLFDFGYHRKMVLSNEIHLVFIKDLPTV